MMLSCVRCTESFAHVSVGLDVNSARVRLVLYVGVWVMAPDLAEEQVELLARAVVSSLGQEELDLLLNLFFIQMPAVLIVDAGSRCGVRGPYLHTLA